MSLTLVDTELKFLDLSQIPADSVNAVGVESCIVKNTVCSEMTKYVVTRLSELLFKTHMNMFMKYIFQIDKSTSHRKITLYVLL